MKGEADGEASRGVSERLDALVSQARAAGLWERAWPILWRGIAVALAFLAASWLGLWLDLGPVWRIAGLIGFSAALAAALAPLLRLGRPTRREALARIDRDAAAKDRALAHNPASALEDTLAVGLSDPATQALWALHRRRAAAAVATLKAGPPRPAMARRDPYAVRAALLLAAAASLFVAGPEWRQRVGAAFDWRAPPAAGPNFRVDGWIDPPLYTRLPPLGITMDGAEQRLRAPVNSTLIVRIAGQGKASLQPGSGLKPLPGKEARSDLREDRFQLAGGAADITIDVSGAGPRRLVIETIPDSPPEVQRAGPPEVNGRGTFNLSYRAKDDYGIASAEGIVEPLKPGRSLVPPPRIALALPADPSGEAEVKTLVDLTDNPWSGARVRLTIVVKDEAGQEGRTQAAEMTLPARPFQQPLARALAEERRRLVTAPDESRARVQTALDALMIAPSQFTPQPSVFLGLRIAARRLKAARSDDDLAAVADLLWEMALKIEDGDLSDAEKSLRAAQDKLKEAIDRGAPDEEVKALTEDLRRALDTFMKQLAEKQQKQQKQQQSDKGQQQKGGKSVTPDDLTKMLKDVEDAMRRGDTAEAQRLLEQLRGILENLQSAEQGKSDPSAREMSKQADELDKMAREQQGLRDETFKDGQQKRGGPPQRGQRPQPGQQGRQQEGAEGGEQGDGEKGQQKGKPGGKSGEGAQKSQRQQALRERLEDLQRRMKEQGLQGEEGLADAEEAMRDAESALGQGKEGDAVDAQGRALDGLKRGADGMQKQMQEMAEGEGEGGQEGGDSPSQQGQAGNRDDDPLGRPTKGRDVSDGRGRVPTADESAAQRTRRIMEELRRKLGDPSRPREELDYFERLLRRN